MDRLTGGRTHAIRNLVSRSQGNASIRWCQSGFLPSGRDTSPRNLLGFKDGTNNIRAGDEGSLRRFVWSDGSDAPWMRDGTYLVIRRIRMLLDVWDATEIHAQERAVGRVKSTGAPLGRRKEHDRLPLSATVDNRLVVPPTAHVRLAAPESHGGARLLRRSYSYVDGVDQATGQIDAGLVFICFQRDPAEQFAKIQRALGQHDALRKFLSHTGSAVFACPPGVPDGGAIGDTLLAR